MRTAFLFLVCLAFTYYGQAQMGISLQYAQVNAPNWDVAFQPEGAFRNGYTVSIDYRFRLKEYRVEFLPEISYSKTGTSRSRSFDTSFSPQNLTTASFHLNTNLYLFDFKGDCDCPTFSKDGNFLKKGFFVQLAPGLNYLYKNSFSPLFPTFVGNVKTWAFDIRAGLGLDIGISDFLTVTPIVQASYMPVDKWEGIPSFEPNIETESSIWRYQAGIRMGVRFDKFPRY